MNDPVTSAILLVVFMGIAMFIGTFPCIRLFLHDEEDERSFLGDEEYHPLCDCPPPSNIHKSTSTETLLTNIEVPIDNCEMSTQTLWV
jgi:hypothetical protein